MPLASTFDKTKTAKPIRSLIVFDPEGAAVAVSISCKILDVDSKLTTVMLKQPGPDDLNHSVDEIGTDVDESMTLVDIEEIDLLITTLGGMQGIVKGSAQVYVRDPRDAASKVKYHIPITYCSLKRADGAVRFGGGEFSKVSLILTNLQGSKLVPAIAANEPA